MKAKVNFKKRLHLKDYSSKSEMPESQTQSTIESKIFPMTWISNCESEFCPGTRHYFAQIHDDLSKYSTKPEHFYYNLFEESFGRTRTKEKIRMKDFSFEKTSDEMMESYFPQKSGQNGQLDKIEKLVEYYKYYINNPVLFHRKELFKTMYHLYERKKLIQYKRLKAILSVSGSSAEVSGSNFNQEPSLKDHQLRPQASIFYAEPHYSSGNDFYRTKKPSSKRPTFYIMNFINSSFKQQKVQDSQNEESDALKELNEDLQLIFKNHKKHISSKSNGTDNHSSCKTPLTKQSEKSAFKKKKKNRNISMDKKTTDLLIKKQSRREKGYKHQKYDSSFKKETTGIHSYDMSPFYSKLQTGNNFHTIIKSEKNQSMRELHFDQIEPFKLSKKSDKQLRKKNRFASCQTVIIRSPNKNKFKPNNRIGKKSKMRSVERFQNPLMTQSKPDRMSKKQPKQPYQRHLDRNYLTKEPFESTLLSKMSHGRKSGKMMSVDSIIHGSRGSQVSSQKKVKRMASNQSLGQTIKHSAQKKKKKNDQKKNYQKKSHHQLSNNIMSLKEKIQVEKESMKLEQKLRKDPENVHTKSSSRNTMAYSFNPFKRK